VVVVPAVSCTRADFKLRREAAYMLQRCLARDDAAATTAAGDGGAGSAVNAVGPLEEELLFLDDVVNALSPPPAPDAAHTPTARVLSVTLVDHNQLSGPLARLLPDTAVVRILDHHADAGAHAHVTGAARAISFDPAERRGVGSTCTLVAEALASQDAADVAAGAVVGDGGRRPLLTAAVAELLLGVILLDTSNLSAHAGKATAADHAAVRSLQAAIQRETGAECDCK
jgi:inorganic pyrophosphatase/exopolyphosphatase